MFPVFILPIIIFEISPVQVSVSQVRQCRKTKPKMRIISHVCYHVIHVRVYVYTYLWALYVYVCMIVSAWVSVFTFRLVLCFVDYDTEAELGKARVTHIS